MENNDEGLKIDDKEKNIDLNEKIIEIDTSGSGLDGLKESYAELKKDFPLPDFDSLNEDFAIEKLQNEDTDFLIREIRKSISDKFSAYLRFLETLLQPSNAQMFVFMMLKSMTSEDMSKMQSIYKNLARKEIEVIELDLKYDIDKEVEFISSAYDMWLKIREDLLFFVGKIKDNWSDNDQSIEKNNHYFG